MFKYINILLIFFIFLLNGNLTLAVSAKSSLVVDLNSGKIIHAENHLSKRYPASLVKMMTLYIAFEQVDQGKIKLNNLLLVSKKAASMPRTNMNLKAGSKVSLKTAILGLIVHSSNDAAVAIAENIAGSEENFVRLMNAKAKNLGMKNTNFKNAHGLPNLKQYSTAYDLAILGSSLCRDFNHYYSWFSVNSFNYQGKTYYSHNHVVKNYSWATGLKTGFTNASGFNIATTAYQDGKHLIGIVLGGATSRERDLKVVNLLEKSLNNNNRSQKIRDKKNNFTIKNSKKFIAKKRKKSKSL